MSVRKRNGKYHYRYDIIDTQTGKRKQKETKGYGSRLEAKAAGVRIEAELLAGTYIEEKDIMLVDWIDRWLEIYAATGKVKNKTVDIRKDSLKIVRRKFAGLKLREVTKLMYQELLNGMKEIGRSRNTIQLTHAASKMMFTKAVDQELIKTSPAVNAEIPAFPQTVEQLETEEELPEYLEKEELAQLLQTAKESGDTQCFNGLFLLAYTGMRIGELCALKVTDIDVINKRISITKTLYARKGLKSFVLNTPKTKASKRKIDFGASVLAVLKDQESWRNEFMMANRKNFYDKAKFVFVNDKKLPGYPARPIRFEQFMHDMLVRAALPTNLTPHSLRHTYTSLMAEAGVELESIQTLLGHENDNITRAVYLHVTKARKKAAVEKLDMLMNGLL